MTTQPLNIPAALARMEEKMDKMLYILGGFDARIGKLEHVIEKISSFPFSALSALEDDEKEVSKLSDDFHVISSTYPTELTDGLSASTSHALESEYAAMTSDEAKPERPNPYESGVEIKEEKEISPPALSAAPIPASTANLLPAPSDIPPVPTRPVASAAPAGITTSPTEDEEFARKLQQQYNLEYESSRASSIPAQPPRHSPMPTVTPPPKTPATASIPLYSRPGYAAVTQMPSYYVPPVIPARPAVSGSGLYPTLPAYKPETGYPKYYAAPRGPSGGLGMPVATMVVPGTGSPLPLQAAPPVTLYAAQPPRARK